jgi:hypothetical protein
MAATWKQLVELAHLKSEPGMTFTRTVQSQQAYDRQRAELKRNGMTSEQKIFGENPGMSDQIVFQKNLFPYWLDSGIVHMVAWIPPKLGEMKGLDVYVSAALESRYARLVDGAERAYPNFVVFEQPMVYRSIKGIRHLHVFYLK